MKVINAKPLSNTAYIAKWAMVNIPGEQQYQVKSQNLHGKIN
jgi:alkyl hydroperoxide reductase subunit AhpF